MNALRHTVPCLFSLTLSLTLATISPAWADGLTPRNSAWVGEAESWSVGIFNPATFNPSDGLELRTHPLLFAFSPNLLVRWQPLRWPDNFTYSFEAGASLPWSAFTLAPPFGVKGYLSPSCNVSSAEPERGDSCQEPGVFLVPRLGAAASWGRDDVLTGRLDVAYGFALAGDRATPLDTYPYLDLLFAPIFDTYRARLGVRYDHEVADWLRAAVEANVWRVGEGPEPVQSPWTYSAYLGVDIALGEFTRGTLGVTYWNSDQRRVEIVEDSDGFAHLERVRSHDFAPTIDIIWGWGSLP